MRTDERLCSCALSSTSLCVCRCRQALWSWRREVSWKRSLHKLRHSLVQPSGCLLQSQIVGLWHGDLRVKVSQEGRVERLRRRHLHRSTFRRWAIGAVQLGTARASLLAAMQHAVHDRFACLFHAWFHTASARKQSRRTVDLLAARRCHAAVSRAWQGWKGWCARCTVHRSSLHGASQALKNVSRTSLYQQVTAVRSISCAESARRLVHFLHITFIFRQPASHLVPIRQRANIG